jgi:hypothetical protein
MIAIDACSWDTPGANPYRGEIPAAIEHYTEIPAPVRAKLRERMERHQYDDVVEIRRDSIAGSQPYQDLRSMHFGNKLCRSVSRAKWSASALERGLVYCEGEHCIIVPTVCSNVSLVTRVPVVIQPAPPDSFSTMPELEPPEVDVPSVLALLDPPAPIDDEPGNTPSWSTWPPIIYGPPLYFTSPPGSPHTPAIPEPGTWATLLAGVAILAAHRCRRQGERT